MGDPPAARAHAPRMQKVLKCALHPGAGVGQGVWSVVGRSTGEGVCGGGGRLLWALFLSPQPCPVSPPNCPPTWGNPARATRPPTAPNCSPPLCGSFLAAGAWVFGVWGVRGVRFAPCATGGEVWRVCVSPKKSVPLCVFFFFENAPLIVGMPPPPPPPSPPTPAGSGRRTSSALS
jgi:hypothetical protein